MSQPRFNISVKVSLDDMLWIAEPLVTKPSMVMHTLYKPEYHVRKMGCYLQGQGHSNWIWVHTMKSWLFLLYVLNCLFFGGQFSLTVHVRKLECLVKRLLCCIQGQGHSEGSGLQWMFARTISLIDQSLYSDASSSARVSFRNIILVCSKSKPQSFLLDFKKYWNFCNPN